MSWTVAECRELAEESLDEMPARWKHVRAVAELVDSWSRKGLVSDVVVKAAWLHDVGYSRRVIRTGMHALDGARYLDLHGLDAEVIALVAHHTGAWAEAEERGLTGQLAVFDAPEERNLDALTLADLTRGPEGERVTVVERLAEIYTRYEEQHPVHRAVTRSGLGLQATAARAAKRLSQPM
ncbi:HD domain-containing protein [Nocardioides daphniae]|uniref:Metal-dependent phosphohydrolase, HD subdomain protein n=1 Tax=Nocardioides daphniae TaxID=402297 RepID=A0ABQ1Q3R5_9ACTN|nr:HD domain-containing protein [Nocardioides daphniae]GGD12605.1 metal-dependent phosphohydrolase, HD subdomain protein [Nocardioides daphniae]